MKRFLFSCVATYLAASLAFAPLARAQEAAVKAKPTPRQMPKIPPEKKASSMAKAAAAKAPAAKAQPAAAAVPAKAAPVPPPAPAPIPPPVPAKPPLPPPVPTAAAAARPAGATELPPAPGEKEFNSCKKLPAGKRIVKLNLKPDTELLDLIGWISSISCTQFLVSVPLQGKKVTIIAPQLISPEEAYRLFLAALDSVGLTVEPTGKFLRIVESARARFAPVHVYDEKERLPNERRFVTKLVRVNYLDANELTNTVLNRIKSEAGDIIAYRSSVLITDQAEVIDRMVHIIRQFDNPSDKRDKIWMIRIKNTSAVDMAARLAEVVPVQTVGTGQRRPGTPAPQPGAKPVNPPGELSTELWITKIIPDERSNSLIVVANDRAYQWLVTIIKKLDVSVDDTRAEGKDGRFHIYNCANANCDELAATLSAITGVQVAGSLTGGPRRRGGTQPQAAPANNQQQTGPNQYMFEGDVRITFDAPTNSLLIMSSFKDYQVLRRVIEKLDAPRKQVFIEAVILEVMLNKKRDIGVSYHAGKPFDNLVAGKDALGLGGFNAGQTLGAGMNASSLLSSMGGLSAALFGEAIPAAAAQTLGLTNVNIPSFGVFLQMVQTNGDVNVLSNPHLLIMNNQEGEITVGENLPFQGAVMGGALTGGASTAGYMPYVSVNRQDVALKLKLLPSVNEHNMIRLDVEQEVSDVSNPNYNNLGPATSKRSTKTTIVARDQQTVVIGGLMGDRVSETVQKVPILGDIPVLGFFFRNTSKTTQKTNIIIAMTPYVVSDLSDLRRVAEKKMRERREFIERYSSLEDNSSILKGVEDYHRKRGMLEEINKTVREVEDEEKQLRLIREMDAESEYTPIAPMAVSADTSKNTPPASASASGATTAPASLTPPNQDEVEDDMESEPSVPPKHTRKTTPTKPAKPAPAIKPQE